MFLHGHFARHACLDESVVAPMCPCVLILTLSDMRLPLFRPLRPWASASCALVDEHCGLRAEVVCHGLCVFLVLGRGNADMPGLMMKSVSQVNKGKLRQLLHLLSHHISGIPE